MLDSYIFTFVFSAATKQLQLIQKGLKNHYKNVSKVNTIQWKVGDICIARYHLDNQWYRGIIVKNLENKLMVSKT